MLLESDPANRIRGILVTRTIPGRGGLWLFGHKAIHPLPLLIPKKHNALKAVGFEGRLEARRNRDAYTLPFQLNRSYPSKTRFATQSSLPHFSRSGSSRPTPVKRPFRSVLSSLHPFFMPKAAYQSSLASRTALVSASILTVGSIAWYTNLYGTLPFIGEVHANSPAEDGLHPTAYPWSHNGLLDTFDHSRYLPSVPILLSPLLTRFKHPTRLPSLP